MRLDKCGQMVTRTGMIVRTEGVSLTDGNITAFKNSYGYLGIPQATRNPEETNRKLATAKYLQRVRQVQRSLAP